MSEVHLNIVEIFPDEEDCQRLSSLWLREAFKQKAMLQLNCKNEEELRKSLEDDLEIVNGTTIGGIGYKMKRIR